MIEDHWTLLKAALLNEGGYDRLVEFLENATDFARIERAKADTIHRQTRPDYALLTPHDLQTKVQNALGASNEH